MIKEMVLGIWLSVLACIDAKYKEIPVWLSVLGGGLGICFCIMEKRGVEEIFFSCIPGIVALIFSKFSKEVIGYGDSIVIFILGIFLTFPQLVSIGALAFGIAGGVALVLLVVFRKKGSYRIPFLPFVWIAYLINYWMIEGGSKL